MKKEEEKIDVILSEKASIEQSYRDVLSFNFCEFRISSLADKIKMQLKMQKLKNIV